MNDLEIRLTAVDEASATVAQASKRITDSLREVSDSQNGLAAATAASCRSVKSGGAGSA